MMGLEKTPETLAELQSHVARAIGIGDPLVSCQCGNPDLATQQAGQRMLTDFVCGQFALECHRNATGMTPRDQERVARRMHRHATRWAKRQRVEQFDASGQKCGFGFLVPILGAVLSWLIGKALDALWGWWHTTKVTGFAMDAMAADAERCGATALDSDE